MLAERDFPSSSTFVGEENSQVSRPSNQHEILQWILRPESTVKCFIGDVLAMSLQDVAGTPVYHLGRVPCRTVKITGIVVGVSEFERRNVITLDDGSGVIECVQPKTPVKPPSMSTQTSSSQSWRTSSQASLQSKEDRPPPVGSIISIVGRIAPWHDSRHLYINELVEAELNEELQHWIEVMALHKTYYHIAEPFQISAAPPTPLVAVPQTPQRARAQPSTPSTRSTITSVATDSSPAGPATFSPIRLKHPSRLHSYDLTSHTFRIYLKHYLDNAANTETEPIPFSPDTPKKSDADRTPKAHRTLLSERTPKANGSTSYMLDKSKSPFDDDRPKGFTLSYLRRVPELGDLALRIVAAERKRRAREERKKEKERGVKSNSKQSHKENEGATKKGSESDRTKSKRLFEWALRTLSREGALVLWDGPSWDINPNIASNLEAHDHLWRSRTADASSRTVLTDSQSASITCTTIKEDPDDELSDPDPTEDVYISVTIPLLAEKVAETILAMECSSMKERQKYAVPGDDPCKAYGRYAAIKARPPSPGEIVRWIARDVGWSHIGERAVLEALELLESQDRVDKAGGGRWTWVH
ncbi:hypothetical protein SISSUDRAFT_1060199 [Sistotremastrum suecicum HHB10207 ss-3]|uniref:CST complex subunit STN1 n=1 Tax=Sistotremastrum suecicum HHB10207 ss-3 TaxID=1314776 RepID=A0A166FEH0_9AGAM|nr:hypothetical protein SISSUDRAFT_1060199 [Sistotremastrum suecicum HHB10207 ss-3]